MIVYQRLLLVFCFVFFFPTKFLTSVTHCFAIWHVNIQQFEVHVVHVPLSPREPSPALDENKGSYRNCCRKFFLKSLVVSASRFEHVTAVETRYPAVSLRESHYKNLKTPCPFSVVPSPHFFCKAVLQLPSTHEIRV